MVKWSSDREFVFHEDLGMNEIRKVQKQVDKGEMERDNLRIK